MSSIHIRATLALAVLAVVAAAPAFAEDNRPISGTGTPTGAVMFGSMLPPTSGSQGEPQSANSLPPGALDGTLAMQHRQALQRHWAEQARDAQHGAITDQQPDD